MKAKVYPKCHCNTGSCIYVCVCVCVCVSCTPHGGLSDTSALEISSGGGSGLNSLPVQFRTRVRTLRSPGISCFGRRENKIWARVGPVIVISCRTRAGLGPERLGPGPS